MDSSSFVFLPHPREVSWLDGAFRIAPAKLILLDVAKPQALFFTARRLQSAIEKSQQETWGISASSFLPSEQVGICIRILPEVIRHSEGYLLKISPGLTEIVANDEAGAFYAACTLEQLLQQVKGELPCLEIRDWPDFPARGVMLDISRDKVYSQDTLYGLVDLLSSLKINQLQLYTEHTFAYRNHPVVWEKASPVSGGDILALDAYCKERFIELVPNQNSFGHMERWLKHPEYVGLAEVTGEFESPWGTMHGPFSLAPEDPGSLALIDSLYDELLPHFSSRMVNIGCDETIDLGAGRSKEACQARGTGRVYLDYVLKIYQSLKRRGFQTQFWGDIIIQHPELVPALPGDLIALEWGYEAGHPFAEHGEKFAAAGIPFYVCPGTSAWNTLAGRTDNTLQNLQSAAENGIKFGAIGYLITDWGDGGHWQVLPVSYLGIAAGAAYSWAMGANRGLDLRGPVSRFIFEDASGAMGNLVYELGNVYRTVGYEPQNSSTLHWALKMELEKAREQAQALVPGFAKALAATEAAIRHLDRAQMQRKDADLVQAEFRQTARLMMHACRRVRWMVEGDPVRAAALRQDIDEILPEYRRIWLARNRPGGLEDSVSDFNRLLQEYQ